MFVFMGAMAGHRNILCHGEFRVSWVEIMTLHSEYYCGNIGFGVTSLSLKVFKWLALFPFPVGEPGVGGSTSTLKPEKLVVGGAKKTASSVEPSSPVLVLAPTLCAGEL